MYPRILEIPLPFSIGPIDSITIYSFGFMVAVAVLTAAWLTRIEMDRQYAAGRLKGVRIPVEGADKNRRRATTQLASPSVLVGTLVVLAVVFGFVGARVFHILENLPDFFEDPFGMLVSSGGFTFYGGLITAAVAITAYVRKKGLSVGVMADAVAPGLMIGYGIGRIGCHLAGDGDWGIASDPSAKPGWLPMWLWNEDYANRIYNPPDFPASGVFPTPLYEFGMTLVFFAILWALRKHPYKASWLFWLYLAFTGIERFLIEQIRVNNEFQFLGMTVTQAEVISTLLFLAGVAGLAVTTRKRKGGEKATAAPPAMPVTAQARA